MSHDDDDDPIEREMRARQFRDPGGKSALGCGARKYPCPTCKQPNRLTAGDKKKGYQCDSCADRDEGYYMGADY